MVCLIESHSPVTAYKNHGFACATMVSESKLIRGRISERILQANICSQSGVTMADAAMPSKAARRCEISVDMK